MCPGARSFRKSMILLRASNATREDRLHARPGLSEPECIGELIEAGMNVARLNFSHGSHEEHAQELAVVRSRRNARQARSRCSRTCRARRSASAASPTGASSCEPGATSRITTDASVLGDDERVSTTYRGCRCDVKPGDHILLDDGLLRSR